MTVEHGYDLKAIRAGLKSILQDISGCGEQILDKTHRPVDEEDGTWTMPDDVTGAVCSFKLISAQSLGFGDEIRSAYDSTLVVDGDTSGPGGDPATGAFEVVVCGNRVLTFSVKVECYDQGATAFEFIENIRTHLNRPSIDARISALGCSVNDIMAARDSTHTYEGRQVSQAGFDLVLNTASNISDDIVTTIETVEITRTEE